MAEQKCYDPPVDELLRLGDVRERHEHGSSQWCDYRTLGLSEADVPELIRMVTDKRLHRVLNLEPAVWAPLHAWRALAQLKAAEAVEPLLGILGYLDETEDDWYLEDFPDVFAMIGPSAVVPLATYLSDAANGLYPRICVSHSLCNIAEHHPDTRDSVVAHLSNQLAKFEENDEALNAFLVSYLLTLKAVESAELIERAYAAKRVDESVVGYWGEVRQELGVSSLGLAPEGPTPGRPRLSYFKREPIPSLSIRSQSDRNQDRAKRKRQRQSRKRNRRHKKS